MKSATTVRQRWLPPLQFNVLFKLAALHHAGVVERNAPVRTDAAQNHNVAERCEGVVPPAMLKAA